jgi:hypothetical protein
MLGYLMGSRANHRRADWERHDSRGLHLAGLADEVTLERAFGMAGWTYTALGCAPISLSTPAGVEGAHVCD